jgi:hypothetical protein
MMHTRQCQSEPRALASVVAAHPRTIAKLPVGRADGLPCSEPLRALGRRLPELRHRPLHRESKQQALTTLTWTSDEPATTETKPTALQAQLALKSNPSKGTIEIPQRRAPIQKLKWN